MVMPNHNINLSVVRVVRVPFLHAVINLKCITVVWE